MPSKNQKELLEFLGPEYSVKEIDYELCIYRKLNDHYDIEISGTARKNHAFSVFVWDISSGEGVSASIAEKHFDIPDKLTLKNLLDDLAHKYGGLA